LQNKDRHNISPWYIFSSPGGTAGAIAIKMRDALSGTDRRLYPKFQPNRFSSFEGDA